MSFRRHLEVFLFNHYQNLFSALQRRTSNGTQANQGVRDDFGEVLHI